MIAITPIQYSYRVGKEATRFFNISFSERIRSIYFIEKAPQQQGLGTNEKMEEYSKPILPLYKIHITGVSPMSRDYF